VVVCTRRPRPALVLSASGAGWCGCCARHPPPPPHHPPADSRPTCDGRPASCAQRSLFLRRRRLPYRITRAARRRRLSSWCVSSEPAKWPGHELRGASFCTVSRSPQPQPHHAQTASCTKKYPSVSSASIYSDWTKFFLKKNLPPLPSLHSCPPRERGSPHVFDPCDHIMWTIRYTIPITTILYYIIRILCQYFWKKKTTLFCQRMWFRVDGFRSSDDRFWRIFTWYHYMIRYIGRYSPGRWYTTCSDCH